MWGSTISNNDTPCDWEHAPFNNGSSKFDSTFFNSVKDTVCPNGVLAKEYDAASHIMGGDWRMPTKAEFQELLDNTNKEWTQVNGVNGYKFTSKKEGFQNNSIFIPAAGNCDRSSVTDVGYNGGVWSSSLDTSYPNSAWYLYFNSGSCYMFGNHRCSGLSVRGVRK